MATLIGFVRLVVGEVFAVAADGSKRQLGEGDRVYAGEQLQTGAGGAVAIRLVSGGELTVGRDSEVQLDTGLLAGEGARIGPATPEQVPGTEDLAEVEQVQQAIAAGVDPTTTLPPTAAGPAAVGAAGDGGGGVSFVMLGETAGRVSPEIGYPTGPLPFAPLLAEEFPAGPGVEPDSGVIIGGLGAQGGEVLLEENDLPGGTDGSGPQSQAGTFSIYAPDGIATISIGGQSFTYAQLANAGDVNLLIDSPAGVLTINGYSGTAAGGTVSYLYTLQTPVANGPDSDQGTESFAVEVSDVDGSSASASLDVVIIDDVPQASNYSGDSFDEGSGSHVIGDAVTVLGISGGADGLQGTLQDIVFSNQGSTGGSLSIDGTGQLVYTAPGSVTSDVAVVETFSYSVTDQDGDSVTRTVTFGVNDTGLSEVSATALSVDEDDIVGAEGNAGGPGDDGQTTSGQLSFTLGQDPLQSISLSVTDTGLTTLDGQAVNTSWDAATHTLTGYAGADPSDVVFTISLTNIGNSGADYSITLLQPVAHPQSDDPSTAATETAFEDNLSFTVDVEVLDADNSPGTTSFTVTIDDDSPLASDYSGASFDEGSGSHVIGAAVTVLGISGGADGLQGALQDIVFSNQGSTGGSLSIDGTGQLVYTAPGNVTSDVAVVETFSYSVTDQDGDSVTRTVAFGVNDTGLSEVSATALSVDEDDIVGAEGNAGGPGDDGQTTSGQLSFTLGQDPLQSISLSVTDTGLTTLDGQTVNTSWDAATHTLTGYAGADPSDVVFTISLTNIGNSGADYSITLLQPVAHPQSDDPSTPATETAFEDNLSFTVDVEVLDADNSPGTTSFTVTIDDDSPLASLAGAGAPALGSVTVDESLAALNGAQDDGIASATLAGATVQAQFTSRYGADGAGGTIYQLVLDGTDVGSGLYAVDPLAAGGKGAEIVLNQSGNVITGSAGGANYFTLTIDPDSGSVTLALLDNLWHGDTASNDDSQSLLLGEGVLTLEQVITDADGDSASIAVDLGTAEVFHFEDDGPAIGTFSLVQGAQVTVDESVGTGGSINDEPGQASNNDETAAGAPVGALGYASIAAASLFSVAVEAGSDGEVSRHYVLGVSAANVDSGLNATAGGDILLNKVGNDIVGTANGVEVFRIGVNASSGEVTVVQYQAIDHGADGNDHDSLLNIASNVLGIRLIVTDGDGDTVISSTLDLGSVIGFEDDGPAIGTFSLLQGAQVTVDESVGTGGSIKDEPGQASNNDETAAGAPAGALGYASIAAASLFSVAVDAGSDGEASRQYVLSVSAANVDSGLNATAGGDILLNKVGNDIVGTANGVEVFRIGVNASSGEVTVVQYQAIDHGADGNDHDSLLNIASNVLGIRLIVTDGDGDTVTSSTLDLGSVIGFEDDGPAIGTFSLVQGAQVTVDESLGTGGSIKDEPGQASNNDETAAGAPAGALGYASIAATSLFSVAVEAGSDGEASRQYVLSVSAANVDSGLNATAGGDILLNKVGNDIVGTANGVEVFRIGVNASSGEVTVVQYQAIDHGADGNDHDSLLSIASNVLGIRLIVTDGDGDTVTSSTLDLGSVIGFEDDGPAIGTFSLLQGAQVTVDESLGTGGSIKDEPGQASNNDETAAGAPAGALGYASIAAASLFSVAVDAGSDGEASRQYVLSVSAANVDSGLNATAGGDILLNKVGNDIVGTANGVEVFRIGVNASSGEVTVVQYQAIDHGADGNDHDSLLNIASNVLGIRLIVTDGDGDTATSSTLDLGSVIGFEDDGPGAFTPDDVHAVLSVDDSLVTPTTVTTSLNFAAAAGSDGVGGVEFAYEFTIDDRQVFVDAEGNPLYLHNEPLYLMYGADHQTLIAQTADGEVAMTAVIDSGGDVSITMFSGTFISSNLITVVKDLSGIGGGNVPFKGLNIGTAQNPDPDASDDVLVSSEIRPFNDGNSGTVNSNSTEMGVGQGNEVSNGEVIRYDLVTGLSVNASPNNQSYSFGGYQDNIFAFKQQISITGNNKDADFKLRIYDTSGSASGANTTLVGSTNGAQLVLLTSEIIIYDAYGTVQNNAQHVAQDGNGVILYNIGNDWTFEIRSVDANGNPEAFNALEIEGVESTSGTVSADGVTTSFKLAEFSFGETSDIQPVSFQLPVTGYDGDGDSVSSSIDMTVYPNTKSIEGTNFADNLIGDNGENYIFGHGGNDLLLGYGGDDILFGGQGNDILAGGDGRDTLVWQAGETGTDTVLGFTKGYSTDPNGDRLDISDLLSGEHGASGDIGNLLQYVDISTANVSGTSALDTIIKISVSGAFDPTDGAGAGATPVDQTIVLQDVDLLSAAPGGYGTTESSVIIAMLDDGTLKVDNS